MEEKKLNKNRHISAHVIDRLIIFTKRREEQNGGIQRKRKREERALGRFDTGSGPYKETTTQLVHPGKWAPK